MTFKQTGFSVQCVQAVSGRANPKSSLAVFKNGPHHIADQGMRITCLVHIASESPCASIQSVQATRIVIVPDHTRAHPKCTLMVLIKGPYFITA